VYSTKYLSPMLLVVMSSEFCRGPFLELGLFMPLDTPNPQAYASPKEPIFV